MTLARKQFAHYTILTLLKKGGMSEVYLADDQLLGRQVAIKVIQTNALHYLESEAGQAAMRLFLQEARTLASLDHPHILPLFDSGQASLQSETFMYMVMPYRHAGSLTEWLRERSTRPVLAPAHVARIVRQAADALQYAHERGIVHQDVKPTNFLLYSAVEYAEQLNLQLADFGIAKILSTTSETLTIRGTPDYMAPEQWQGKAYPASDQYALAVLAYELLTGWLPFPGQNYEQLYHQHSYSRPHAPSAINPRIPADLDEVLLKALAKRPAGRFPSISAFAEAFERGTGRDNHIAAIPPLHENVLPDDLQALSEPLPTAPQLLANTAVMTSSRRSRLLHTLIPFLLAMLLLFSAGGLIFYTSFSNAQQTALYTTATALSRTHSTSTSMALASIHHTATARSLATQAVQSNETATVSTRSTAIAQINATATAVAKAEATSTAIATSHATATAQANATAIAGATATAYARNYSGQQLLDDPLQDNSQGNMWDEYKNSYSACAFETKAYHSYTTQSGTFSPCFAMTSNFGDCFYQIQMSIIKGDRGGIILRVDPTSDSFYEFFIDTHGNYALEIYSGYNLSGTLKGGNSPYIKTGLDQINLIAVKAIGNSFMLFVNMQNIGTFTDDANTYSQGQIGIVAESVNNSTDVAFNNAEVWTPTQ